MAAVRYDEATRTYEGTEVPAVDSLSLDDRRRRAARPRRARPGRASRPRCACSPASSRSTAARSTSAIATSATSARATATSPWSSRTTRCTRSSRWRENMGFALKQHGVPKEERTSRVRETARMLDLTPFLDRKPKHLSGGQRQRVAMGRAIVRRTGGLPHGRAALEPRREAACADAHRGRRAAEPARRDHGLRHPRPGRGDDDGRSSRGAQGRSPPAVRRSQHALPRAGQPVRGRVHRLAGDEPRRCRRRAAAEDRRGRSSRSTDPARRRSETAPAGSRSDSVPRR